jgi:hypothetical protein
MDRSSFPNMPDLEPREIGNGRVLMVKPDGLPLMMKFSPAPEGQQEPGTFLCALVMDVPPTDPMAVLNAVLEDMIGNMPERMAKELREGLKEKCGDEHPTVEQMADALGLPLPSTEGVEVVIAATEDSVFQLSMN